MRHLFSDEPDERWIIALVLGMVTCFTVTFVISYCSRGIREESQRSLPHLKENHAIISNK